MIIKIVNYFNLLIHLINHKNLSNLKTFKAFKIVKFHKKFCLLNAIHYTFYHSNLKVQIL